MDELKELNGQYIRAFKLSHNYYKLMGETSNALIEVTKDAEIYFKNIDEQE